MWSLICPNRTRRGSVRMVSMARVRTDLFTPATASDAPRAIDTANSDTSATPCMTRDVMATPDSLASGVESGIGTMLSGRSAPPDSHCTQFATVGQVMVDAFDPTTRPKCPARIITS